MKTLDRKIEEDITQVVQNNSYPTQIVINLDDLKPVDETHWQVGDTDIILTGQKPSTFSIASRSVISLHFIIYLLKLNF